MSLVTLPLEIGLGIGLILSLGQAISVYTGVNTKAHRPTNRTVWVLTFIQFFIFWSVLIFVISLVVVSVISLIL